MSKRVFVSVLAGAVVLSGVWGSVAFAASDTKPDVFGTITKIGDGSMTLQLYKSGTVDVAFNDATVVTIEKNPGKTSDLKVGMHAGAWVKQGQPATKIFAYTPKANPTTKPASTEPKPDVFGTITKIGDGSMTLQPYKSETTVDVAFNDSTVVIIGKEAAKASDLKVGMHAAAWVKGSNPATKISAYMPKAK